MSALEISEKPLPYVRLATLTEKVDTQPEVAVVVGPLFDRVADALLASGATPGLPIAEYDMDRHGCASPSASPTMVPRSTAS